MKLGFLLAFLLVACSSKTTKMTPAETEILLSRHPNFLQSIRQHQDPERSYKHRYLDCTGSEDNEKCYQIECIGVHEGLNCWKTELSKEEFSELRSHHAGRTGKDPKDLKTKCESVKESLSVRRQSCFEYLGANDSNEPIESLISTLKIFCDLDGVSCTKNGVQFGKGNIENASFKGNLRGNEIRIHRKNPDWVDHYQFSAIL